MMRMLHRLTLVLFLIPSGLLRAQDVHMADAGGHRLAMILKGSGQSTVVFDAGMSGHMHGWDTVRDSVALRARTVIFERAGFPPSEPGPTPRTAQRIARELHTALRSAGVAFPIVLVGHSAGGFFSVVYARMYPEDLQALVLVDAATNDAYEYLRDSFPSVWARRAEPQAGGAPADVVMPVGWVGQMEALPVSMEEFRRAWPLPRIPTLVVTAMKPLGGSGPEAVIGTPTWGRWQAALRARLPGAHQLILSEANHGDVITRPEFASALIQLIETSSRR